MSARRQGNGGTFGKAGGDAAPTRRTVLIVDDEDDFRELFADALRPEIDRVLEAHSGEEALAILTDMGKRREPDPDLVVVDLLMPRMSGIELLQRLRRSPRWSSLPVLVVTAVNDPMLPVRLDVPIAFKTDAETLLNVVHQQLAARAPAAV